MSDEAINTPVAAPEAPAAPADGMTAALAMLTAPPPAPSPAPEAVPATQPVIQGAPPPAEMAALQKQIESMQAQLAQAQELQKQYEAAQAELSDWRKLPEVGKYEFAKVLEKLGMTPEDVIRQAPNGGQLTPEQRRVMELEKRLEAFEKSQKQTQEQAQQAQRAQLERQFVENLRAQAAQSTKHDLVKAMGDDAVAQVKAVIEQHYLETQRRTGRGEELSFDQAADIVEQHLERILDERLSKASKFQKKYVQPAPTAPKLAQTPKTLTGNMAGTSQPSEGYDPEAAFRTALSLLKRQ